MKQRDKETKLGPVGRLLKTSKQWTRGTMARVNKVGRACAIESKEAQCWCLMGAVFRCYKKPSDWARAFDRLTAAIGTPDIAAWNDKRSRTFRQIRAAVVKAGI